MGRMIFSMRLQIFLGFWLFGVTPALAQPVFGAVGDIIFHGALQKQALIDGRAFGSLWQPVEGILRQAEFWYGNLEGPSAFAVMENGQELVGFDGTYRVDSPVYSPATEGKSYSFNFHPQSLIELKRAGFEYLSLANNHAGDRGSLGVFRTRESCRKSHLQCFGTSPQAQEPPEILVTSWRGRTLAWVSCSYTDNSGRAIPFMNLCFQGQRPHARLLAQIKQAKQWADYVIFTPHWGDEYSLKVAPGQRELAREAISAGADLILGHHPHVLQAVEQIQGKWVFYSLGNWVTNQFPYDYKDPVKQSRGYPQRVSMMVLLAMSESSSEPFIIHKVIPVYMATSFESGQGYRQLFPISPPHVQGNKALKMALERAQSFLQSGPLDPSIKLILDRYAPKQEDWQEWLK
jgi:hypothetical protein